jgi:hypothetical protein
MKNIDLPSSDNSKENLKTVFTYVNGTKKYDYTEDELSQIITLYTKYHTLKGHINESDPDFNQLSNPLKIAIKDAYSEVQKGGRLKEFRKDLLSLSKKCPICRFTVSTSLDHQMPKDKFEIYSIYSRNLAPMCITCNNIKRTCEVGDTDESFYHIYYDILPNEHFLKANLEIVHENFLSFTFSIEQSKSMSENMFNKLKFIFDRLNLDERWEAEVNGYIFTLKNSFNQQTDVTILDFLDKEIKDHIDRYGNNHWMTSILIALRGCPEFYEGLYKIYNVESD